MLAYLESLDASLLTATTKEEIEEINQEMLGSGLLKDTNKRRKMPDCKISASAYPFKS